MCTAGKGETVHVDLSGLLIGSCQSPTEAEAGLMFLLLSEAN